MNSRTLVKNGSTLGEAHAEPSPRHSLGTWKNAPAARKQGMRLAYFGLVLFVLIYCVRPNDWTGRLMFPFARIAAIIALAGFVPAMFFQSGSLKRIPSEVRYLLLLFLHLVVCIPFSVWSGGSSDQVFNEFSKVVLIALCVSIAVNSLKRLRALLFVQTFSVGVMVLLVEAGLGKSISTSAGTVRQAGVVGGIFENPNDFAFAIAIIFPLAIWFCAMSRNFLFKLFWGAVALAMVHVVLLTLSRGGLLAISVSAITCIWELGIKSKRYVLVAFVLVSVLALVLAAPGQLVTRAQSILDFTKDETGSGWARRALLMKGIETAFSKPLFGVGPGNFQIFSGDWHGTHNTYVQLGSEAGIPAFLLFCLVLWKTFGNLRQVQAKVGRLSDFGQLTGALKACLFGYIVGAFFGDTAFHFFPYLMIAYVSALRLMMQDAAPEELNRGVANGKRRHEIPRSSIALDSQITR